MNYQDAYRMVVARTEAAVGVGPGEANAVAIEDVPDMMCRRLLSGLVDHDEMELLLEKSWNITRNAVMVLEVAPDLDSQLASLRTLFVQNLMVGLLMGRGREA